MAKSAVDASVSKFQLGLICYAKKLKRRAAGRVCGDCRFYVCGLCVEQDIDVNNKFAVACKRYEEKATI